MLFQRASWLPAEELSGLSINTSQSLVSGPEFRCPPSFKAHQGNSGASQSALGLPVMEHISRMFQAAEQLPQIESGRRGLGPIPLPFLCSLFPKCKYTPKSLHDGGFAGCHLNTIPTGLFL